MATRKTQEPRSGERIFRHYVADWADRKMIHGLACGFALSRSRFAQPWLYSYAALRLNKDAAIAATLILLLLLLLIWIPNNEVRPPAGLYGGLPPIDDLGSLRPQTPALNQIL